MEKQDVENVILKSKEIGISEKDICINLGINPKNLYYYKKKYDLLENTRGKSINSRKKREYYINDNFFEIPNLLNSYWAGFLAADGNISRDYCTLTIGLSAKDRIVLENFIRDTDSNYKIKNYKSNGCDCVGLAITSAKICQDLKNNFNITDRKSLTLIHPNLTTDLSDSFIVGYIDGDGTIGLYNSKKQKSLSLSLLGTTDMCS